MTTITTDYTLAENHAAALGLAREAAGDRATVTLELSSEGKPRLRVTGCTSEVGRAVAIDAAKRLSLWGEGFHAQRSVATVPGFVCVWLY
jgi:hypothetical protein